MTNNPDEVPTLRCAHCSADTLLDAHGLCPRCASTQLRWSTFALYTSTTIVALVLIGVLLHVLFPR